MITIVCGTVVGGPPLVASKVVQCKLCGSSLWLSLELEKKVLESMKGRGLEGYPRTYCLNCVGWN